MDKINWIITGVEAILFFAPLVSIIIKSASWRKELELKVAALDVQIKEQKEAAKELKESLDKMNTQLTQIATLVNLLVDNKIDKTK